MQLLRRRRRRGVLPDVRGHQGGLPQEGLEVESCRGPSRELVAVVGCLCCRF